MTEFQLSKFISDHNIEWHWSYHIDGKHLVIFIPPYQLADFCDMLGRSIFDDEGLPCDQRLLAGGYVGLACFEDVCEYYGIQTEAIFPKDEEYD